MEAIVRKEDGKIIHINGAGFGTMVRSESWFDYVDIPNQDVSHLYVDDPNEGLYMIDAYYPADVVRFTEEEILLKIDKSTGAAIDAAVHPLCGIDEQIGILRDQIARMLNGDMTASGDFARLNEIAIAEIEKARIEKEAL